MKIQVEPGKYVVAVSGGVDSVVLLDLLVNFYLPTSTFQLVVAHFDHGIRENSAQDCKFVGDLAKKYGLKFVYKAESLGSSASEELARNRRYKFLESVLKKHKADAIITAHHKDDILETAVFNLLRGTGRGGLSSLKTTEKIVRPLLNYKKSDILSYAHKNNLQWREDPTNKQLKYSRNKIRSFLAQAPIAKKDKLEEIVGENSARNAEIDELIKSIFDYGFNTENRSFDRSFFISLPHKIASELLVFWLKKLGCKYDKKLVVKLVNDLKTLQAGSKTDIDKNHYFELTKKQIGLRDRQSV